MIHAGVLLRRIGTRERDGEAGQALIELALTMPLLILFLMGALEFGQVAFISIQLSNAAKAAAQYGAQNSNTAIDRLGMQAIAQSEVTAVNPVTVALDDNTCSCSSPDTATPSFACLKAPDTSCAFPSHIVQTLTISVSGPFTPGFFVPGFSRSAFTLTGTAVQKRLQ
jgi:Flp pilus assembly protein TadG